MNNIGLTIAFCFACTLLFIGGIFYSQGSISNNCDNYGKSEIDGTWYECKELK